MAQTKKRRVPVNLRQSGDADIRLLIGTRVRKSPYWHKSVEHGARAATVYNHMFHPRLYFDSDQGALMGEYEYLTRHVTMWNVAVERQIMVRGPDALAFVDFVVTRDMQRKLPVGQARYVVLCDTEGGIVNDPVLLRIAEDECWFSISDSDVALWLKGINHDGRWDVEIAEIDVAPIQIQGPKSQALMRKLFGEALDEIRYYRLWQTTLHGMSLVISRTGFSGEVGFEIYLRDATAHADRLWDIVWQAGQEFHLRVVAPGHIRRIEAGILSYGQDMDLETDPFEAGLDWQYDPDKPGDYIGKAALARLAERGPQRRLVGLVMGGPPITWYNADFWLVHPPQSGDSIGYVTSAFFSPKIGENIALAMLPIAWTDIGTDLAVALPSTPEPVAARVHPLPFYDPHKHIPTGGAAAA